MGSTVNSDTTAIPKRPVIGLVDSPTIKIEDGIIEISPSTDTNTGAMFPVKLSQDEGSCSSPCVSTEEGSFEQTAFSIKDVTDYSSPSKVESVDSEELNEGLLRGWSTDGDAKGDNNKEKALKALRKASVAVTGTALVVAGIPMIPMPTPGGVVVCGSGLALLATEFPAAQRVLDKSRDGLAKMVGEEEDDSDEDEDGDKEGGEKNSTRNKGYAKIGNDVEHEDEDDEDQNHVDDSTLVSEYDENSSFINDSERSTRSNRSRMSERGRQQREKVDEVIKNARKTGKRTKRNLKKFVRGTVLPLMSKITTQKEGASDSESIHSATTSPKKRGKELSDQKDSSKVDTNRDVSFSPENKGYREKTTDLRVENNTDGSIMITENISEDVEVSAEGIPHPTVTSF
jgi:hypothetical protein